MRRFLSLSLLLVSCATQSPAPRPHAPSAAPRLAPTAQAKRVVLLSFDGLGADALARQQNLPAFERIAREGMSARVINVDPTLTGPTHVSMLTGADPQRHGVVSNRFHFAGDPVEKVARGVEVDPDVESLIEAARRQGKRVGAVSFPTIDNRSARRTADFGLAWSYPLAPARLVTLTRNDFKREWVPPTWTNRPRRRQSFSPIMRARIEWAVPAVTRTDVDVVAYDTTDDARENYDTFIVEVGESEVIPDARGWFAASRRTTAGLHGSWSKILRVTPSLDVTIYWGSTARNMAWPESFRTMLDEEIGFWPGEPEEELAVDAETFVEQGERLAGFYTRVQTLSIARMTFDLLFAYQPQIDEAAHRYLGTAAADRVLRAAFVAADRGLAAIAEALQPDDALVVTGDHGLMVVDREVRLNTLLAEHGFAPRWRAYVSGAHAHLYRFSATEDAEAVVNLLTSSGHFERVVRKTASMHPHSGDVVAWALPNVALVSDDLTPSVITPTPRGQHGALNTHRELHPPFFAIGAGVPAGAVGEVRQTRIARFISSLLGIAPPAAAE
jgi:predicted AlkP superfamily pyrophosphatase or phosphodiesterase